MPTTLLLIIGERELAPHQQAMEAVGFSSFFCSLTGGGKTAEQSLVLLRTVVKLLLRIHAQALRIGAVQFPPSLTMMNFFAMLVAVPLLCEAVSALVDNYPHSAGSLAVHLYGLREGLGFLRHHLRMRLRLPKRFDRNLEHLNQILCNCAKGAKLRLKRQRRSADNSEEEQVRMRRRPPGGLAELNAILQLDIDAVLALYSGGTDLEITDIRYKKFLEVLINAFYVQAPSGRISAYEHLSLRNYHQLQRDGYCLSKWFKTEPSQQFQPVIASDNVMQLLSIYVERLRPAVLGSHVTTNDADILFLTYNAKPWENIGRLVSTYWSVHSLHITTTILRSMQATEMQRKCEDGLISSAALMSINKVNGHSAMTSRKYYVKTQLRLDVASARVAYGMAPVVPLVPIVPFAPMIWGRLHPNFSSPPGMKVAWSETELGHLGALCAAILEESPAAESRMCAIALKRIRNDPSSFDVYHERHIFSSARLRVGVIGCRRLGFL